MKRYIHLFLIALLSLDSCTQNQFKYTVSDYNSNEGIKRVNTPVTVIKKESPVGIGSRILMPLIGGFFGYKYLNLTTGYTNDGVKTVSAPLGAGTGAVIGFGISNALISSQKKQKVSELQNNTKEYEEWLRKSFNKRGNYIAVGDYTSWIFVDKNRESNFQIRNFQDLDLFCKAFPNSGYHDRVIDQAVANFDRNDLRYAIALSNTPERTSRLKDAFLNKSSSYTEVIDAYQAYPTLKERAELKFMELLDSKDAILAFIKEYPNSKYNNDARILKSVINVLSTCTDAEVKTIFEKYSNLLLNENELKKVTFSNTEKLSYFSGLSKIQNFKTSTDIHDFIAKYLWLKTSGIENEYLNCFWRLANTTYRDEDSLYSFMNQVTTINGKDYGITHNMVTERIKKLLVSEVSKIIVNTKVIEPNNQQYKDWLNNHSYTAGLVSESGAAIYAVYGEIKNTSKFSLPIRVEARAEIIRHQKVEEGGNFLSRLFAQYANKTGMESTELVSVADATYKVPVIKPGETLGYAVELDFGNHVKKAGVNVGDLFKVTSSLKFVNLSTNVSFDDIPLTIEQSNKQSEWQKIAKFGYPNAKLYDYWRGKEVNDYDWREQYRQNQSIRRADDEKRKIGGGSECYEIYELFQPLK